MIREALVLYINENWDRVKVISQSYLDRKRTNLHDYLDFICKPKNIGDELALYLVARMTQMHVCVLLTDTLWTTTIDDSSEPCLLYFIYHGHGTYADSLLSSAPLSPRGRRGLFPKKPTRSASATVECEYPEDTSDEEVTFPAK